MLNNIQISKIQKKIKNEGTSLVDVFSLLGDKNRYLIMKILINEGETCVSDIANILEVSVSAVSQHLRILEMSKMVECQRMGQMMCYKPRLDNQIIKRIISLI